MPITTIDFYHVHIDNSKQNVYERKSCTTFVPWFVLSMATVQILAYTLQTDAFVDLLCYSPRRREELKRFLCYSLFHINFIHFFANFQALLIFGYYTEKSQGPWWTAIIYFTGTIAGSVGCDAFDRKRRVIGNSATCSSLIYANVADLLVNWKGEKLKERRTFIVLVYVVCDLCSWPIITYLLKILTISWSSHFFGGLNGLVGGLASLKLNEKLNSKLYLSNLYIFWFIGYILYICLIYALAALLEINC